MHSSLEGLPDNAIYMKDSKRLSELAVGSWGRVCRLNTTGDMRRRFLDVGILPGTRIFCIGKSPFADPRAYSVRGKIIAIRSADAKGIILE